VNMVWGLQRLSLYFHFPS